MGYLKHVDVSLFIRDKGRGSGPIFSVIEEDNDETTS